MVKTAIIVCGGQSKRLRPLTDKIPKPLVEVNGKPLIEYTFDVLLKNNIEKAVLACGYKWEMIKDRYGDDFKGLKIIYSPEPEPLGTAGAVKLALKHVDEEEFFTMNSDEIHDLDLKEIEKRGSNLVCLSRFRCRFGIAKLDDGKILGFEEKPMLDMWANMGVSFLNKSILPFLPDRGSIEADVYPKLELKAYKHTGFWMTVNIVKDISDAEKALRGERIL